MILFFALVCFSLAIAGATAFVIFWPLALVHLRDRHAGVRAGLGDAAFLHPRALWWLLSGQYRTVEDRAFTGLATPAWVSMLVILSGVGLGGVLWVWGQATGAQ